MQSALFERPIVIACCFYKVYVCNRSTEMQIHSFCNNLYTILILFASTKNNKPVHDARHEKPVYIQNIEAKKQKTAN